MGTVQAGGDLSAGGEELPSDLDGNSTGGGGERKASLSMCLFQALVRYFVSRPAS